MRPPRMTTRRWMILIVVVAVDLTLIVQRASHLLATIAFLGTLAVVALFPVMLLLLMLSADD
jgi:hypothetical protein